MRLLCTTGEGLVRQEKDTCVKLCQPQIKQILLCAILYIQSLVWLVNLFPCVSQPLIPEVACQMVSIDTGSCLFEAVVHSVVLPGGEHGTGKQTH